MRLFKIHSLLFAALLLASPPAWAQGDLIPPYDASASDPVSAAVEFLDALDPAEKDSAALAIDAPVRREWSNLPASFVTRPGVRLGDLSGTRRDLLFRFLSSALGAEGYRAMEETVAAEAALASDSKAERLGWSADNYWLAFYGAPSAEGNWGWHFGGHHLAMNGAMEGARTKAMSPLFIGTEPAIFVLDGRRYEPVGRMHKAGTAVYAALDEKQQSDARLFWGPGDLATGAGEDGEIPSLKGSAVADWTAEQRALLLSAMGEWARLRPGESAELRMRKLESELDATYFAWHGPVDGSDDNYFRIQGPSVIIELLWQGAVGAESEGHYHTIHRDPTNEYGLQMK